MKALLALLVICLLPFAHAQEEAAEPEVATNFNLDASHADVGFKVKHLLVSNTRGHFSEMEGGFDFDLESNTLRALTCTIDTASIDTNNEKRDKHLRNEDFFDVENYPNMTFTSTEVARQDDGTYLVTGDFTLLETTRSITFEAEISGPIQDPWGNTRIGFEFETEIDRTDYGMDHSPTMIGKEVKIIVSAEGILQQPDEETETQETEE